MLLYYYNETTTNTTVEVVEESNERKAPYFLYGNPNGTIHTNVDLVPDGLYSIQSIFHLQIRSESEDDASKNATNTQTITVPTPSINFTLYPCVE
jgi:hypothetical protein